MDQCERGPRTRGDGMEAGSWPGGSSPESLQVFSGSSLEQHVLRHLVRQQRAGRSLAQVLGDAAPESMCREAQSATVAPSSVSKMGKFVPYEPYTACIAAITSPTILPTTNSPLCTTVSSISYSKPVQLSSKSCSNPDQLSGTISCGSCSDQKQLEQQVCSLKQQVKKLTEEKDKLQQRFQLANQVSDELKRLVVASMGEDIESRLSLITEDKARMADLVRDFSDTVARQSDSHENLAIKCDVLRSKYMAYSLMVEELSHWKCVLSSRNQQSEQVVSTLLSELKAVSNNIIQSLRLCDRYSKVKNTPPPPPPTTTTTTTAYPYMPSAPAIEADLTSNQRLMNTVTASHELYQRLRELLEAGSNQLKAEPSKSDGCCFSLVQSEAEKSARQLLATPISADFSAGWQRHSTNISSRFHPSANFDRLTLNCCKNCSGDVHIV